jgi:hypothetical protein
MQRYAFLCRALIRLMTVQTRKRLYRCSITGERISTT